MRQAAAVFLGISALMFSTMTALPSYGNSGSNHITSEATQNATTIYRLYNPASGEHLYTRDTNEFSVLTHRGWYDEGTAWVSPSWSQTPVYRLYNRISGEHHYTTDGHEVQVLTSRHHWTKEGIAWYSSPNKEVSVYRQYNPGIRIGQHHYTTNTNEYDVNNSRNGWRGEGVAWHALAAGQPKAHPYVALRAKLRITEDYRSGFNHGIKNREHQKYIVLHDTEVNASAKAILNSWQNTGAFVAAHFIVEKDGSILQVLPLDAIAHHAGFGDTGHNALYGVTDESRDDKRGTVPIGSWARDYGMNSYSIGIEMVHVSGSGGYPAVQLEAVDGLIAYIDAYYAFESRIIDHKAWRSGNSDTSAEFAGYLSNYQKYRKHKAY